jgi:hypothetical protein
MILTFAIAVLATRSPTLFPFLSVIKKIKIKKRWLEHIYTYICMILIDILYTYQCKDSQTHNRITDIKYGTQCL